MRRLVLLCLLLTGCATATPHVYPAKVRFEDGSEAKVSSWVCVPDKEPASLKCVALIPFLQWLMSQGAHGQQGQPNT